MPTSDKWTQLDELCLLLAGLTREEVTTLRQWAATWRIVQSLGTAIKWAVGMLGLLAAGVAASKTLLMFLRGGF